MSNVVGEIQSAPHTFTNWDACMSKVYCKWPVIAGIIVGSLILLSIIWCVASCLCCGATLCSSCVKCLTCFRCCGMCGSNSGGGGGSSHKRHRDDYAHMPPTPYNGYQPPPAPMGYTRSAPPEPSYPQYAQFDDSKKVGKINEDALPSMPTWAAATSRRVEDNSQPAQGRGHDVEMGHVTPSPVTSRGPYSQLPTRGPVSPPTPSRQNQSYFEGTAQPYHSDLGAERMPLAQHDDQRYNEFTNVPMSPAPTYTSQPPPHMIGAAATTNHYMSSASPPPQFASRGPYSPTHDRYVPPSPHQQSYIPRSGPSPMPVPEDYNGTNNYNYPQQSRMYAAVSSQSRSPYAGPPRHQSPLDEETQGRYEVSDPTYQQYQQQQQQQQQHQQYQQPDSSYRPYSTSPPQGRPAVMHNTQRYSYDDNEELQQSGLQSHGARPPSLLQVGRKAVQGSRREI